MEYNFSSLSFYGFEDHEGAALILSPDEYTEKFDVVISFITSKLDSNIDEYLCNKILAQLTKKPPEG